MAAIARIVFVHGRVQGVGFRWFATQRADELGVAGWVRNRYDGSVEAWCEGEPAAVEALLDALREGPRFARVDGVDVREREPKGLAGFETRPTA